MFVEPSRRFVDASLPMYDPNSWFSNFRLFSLLITIFPDISKARPLAFMSLKYVFLNLLALKSLNHPDIIYYKI